MESSKSLLSCTVRAHWTGGRNAFVSLHSLLKSYYKDNKKAGGAPLLLQKIRNQAYTPAPPSSLPFQPGNWWKPLRGMDLPKRQRSDSWMSTHQTHHPTVKTIKTKKLHSHTLSFQSAFKCLKLKYSSIFKHLLRAFVPGTEDTAGNKTKSSLKERTF